MQSSKRFRRLALAAMAMAAVSLPPFAAGSVYVPLPGNPVDGVDWDAQVVLTNRGLVDRSVNSVVLALASDGTKRGAGLSTTVPGGKTQLLEVPDSAAGLLELAGGPQFTYTARLVRNGEADALGVALPIITSDNAFAAGERLFLHGWLKTADKATDLSVVNLGHAAATCAVRYFDVDGTPVAPAATIGLPPLSHRLFSDVLQLLGLSLLSDVRADVTCDQAFYAFSLVRDNLSGELAVIEPAAAGENGLPDVGGGGGPSPAPSCANNPTCYQLAGVVHVPTKANMVRRVTFNPPVGTYEQIHLQMDVTVGPWGKPSDGLHNIFWLARDRNKDLFGYVNLKGPGDNAILFRHGIGQAQGDKARLLKAFAAQVGSTYHFDYVYDTRAQSITLIVSRAGQELARVTDEPDVNHVHVDPGQVFHIDLGFNGENPNEPPTIGWTYSNIVLAFSK
jgi:hypothetical protein